MEKITLSRGNYFFLTRKQNSFRIHHVFPHAYLCKTSRKLVSWSVYYYAIAQMDSFFTNKVYSILKRLPLQGIR